MSVRSISLALLALALASTACQQPVQETAGLSDEDVAAIRQSNADAVRTIPAADWDAWVEFYTPDAVILPPNGAAVTGPDAMKAWAEEFPALADMSTSILEIDGQGDLAFVRGTYSMTFAGEGEPAVDTGKYIEIWRKQPDGSWRIVRDIFNSDLPLPE